MFFLYLFMTACLSAFAATLWALAAGLLMLLHFKSRSDRFSAKTLCNPMNVIFRPELLTERGLRLRRQVGYASALFTGCLVIAGLIGLVARSMH